VTIPLVYVPVVEHVKGSPEWRQQAAGVLQSLNKSIEADTAAARETVFDLFIDSQVRPESYPGGFYRWLKAETGVGAGTARRWILQHRAAKNGIEGDGTTLEAAGRALELGATVEQTKHAVQSEGERGAKRLADRLDYAGLERVLVNEASKTSLRSLVGDFKGEVDPPEVASAALEFAFENRDEFIPYVRRGK
jgi:hypothetical protein